jgi:quercetin dioxygenase-like cupin family protein
MQHTRRTVTGVAGVTTAAAATTAVVAGLPAAATDDGFAATGRPETTSVLVGPEGPVRFTDRVTMRMRIKLDGRRLEVLRMGDPSGVATATFELEPGDAFPWHTHPGPVLVSVVDGGELSYVRAADCVVRPYAAGAAFVEPGPRVHTAFNAGDETITLVGTFFDVGPGDPLASPVAPERQAALDQRCGLDTVPE